MKIVIRLICILSQVECLNNTYIILYYIMIATQKINKMVLKNEKCKA